MPITIKLPGCNRDAEVRGMKVREMQLLTNPAQVKSGHALKTILTNCLQTPDIDVDTLLTCDCNALLLAARRATFGDDYDFNASCPNCGQSSSYTVNLSEMQAKLGEQDLARRQLQDGETTHVYIFPECGRAARFRLCVGLSVQNAAAGQEMVDALMRRIVAVDGLKESGMPLRVFLRDELSAGDATDFLEYYARVEPGYDDQARLTCPKCGTEFELTLPLEANGFFRRSKPKSCGEPSFASPVKAALPSESTCPGPSATA